MHVPVMLAECLEYLEIKPDGVYLDATTGLGGHSGAIARRLTTGTLYSCDRDAESLEMAKRATADCAARIRYCHTPFSRIAESISQWGESLETKGPQLDGLLADLGVSRFQLTAEERGFSFLADGPLDMRMNRAEGPTAADFVNQLAVHELADLIYKLGEERRSRQIAQSIVRARPIQTTGHLAKVIAGAAHRTGSIHPATQTFMALRMAVNSELEEIESLLQALPQLVKPGGRAVFLTFHSIEDRLVKQAFQALARADEAEILTRHVVKPSQEEVRGNPPSRSAKLRAIKLLPRKN